MIYALANLYLAFTWICFTAFRKVSALAHYRALLHWGQALIALSILAAVLVPRLPRPSYAPIPFTATELWDPDSGAALPRHRPTADAASPAIAEETRRTAHRPRGFAFSWIWLLVAGIVPLLARLACGLRELRAWIGASTLYRRIGRVEIRIGDDVQIPFATRGMRKAYIVIPADLLASRKQLFIAIRHELQHHRQGDTIWVYLAELLKIAFFPNPAIYLWSRELGELQELACDQAIVGRGIVKAYDYGHCLIDVAEKHLNSSKFFMAAAGMGHGGTGPRAFLRRRIQMLDSHLQRGSGLKLGLLFLVSTLGLGLLTAESAVVFGKPNSAIPHPTAIVDNSPIQSAVASALAHGLERTKAKGAFAIVSDVNDGTLLATVHASRTANGEIVFDSAESDFLSQDFNPWSVAKPFTVALAIERGLTNPQEVQNCENGAYDLNGLVVHDWTSFDHLTTAEALAHSSNIGIAKIAEKIGGQSLEAGLKTFGFTQFPGSARSDALLAITLSDGQAFLSNPIEVTEAYAALANGGSLYAPRSFGDAPAPRLVRQVISNSTSQQMREMLAGVVLDGTGKAAATPDYTTAGKTGTGWRKVYPSGIEHDIALASFAGFAPASHPRLAAYVVVEAPRDEHPVGGVSAAPIFSEIVESSLSALRVPSDRSR